MQVSPSSVVSCYGHTGQAADCFANDVRCALTLHVRLLATADEAAVEDVVTLGRMTCSAPTSSLSQQMSCIYSAVKFQEGQGGACKQHARLQEF